MAFEKVAGFRVQSGVLDAVSRQLLASAANSGLDSILIALHLLHALSYGNREVVAPKGDTVVGSAYSGKLLLDVAQPFNEGRVVVR